MNPNLISAGAGLIGSVINHFSARSLQREQNAFNQKMIDEQNAYNSPLATLNRMVAAGVPEKAALRSIAGVPSLGAQPTAATSADYPGNMPATDFANVYAAVASTANLKADARLKNAQAEGIELDNSSKPQATIDAHNLAVQQTRQLEAQTKETLNKSEVAAAQKIMLGLQNDMLKIDKEFYNTKVGYELAQMAVDVGMTTEELIFNILTFEDRQQMLKVDISKASAEEKESLAAARHMWQIINSNAPEESKAKNLERWRKRNPKLARFFDHYRNVRDNTLVGQLVQALGGALTKIR